MGSWEEKSMLFKGGYVFVGIILFVCLLSRLCKATWLISIN